MSLKKKTREFRHWMGWAFFILLERLVTYLPLEVIYFFSEKLGSIAYYLPTGYGNRVLKHLHLAFDKEKGRQEIEDIARDVGRNLLKEFLELQHVVFLPHGDIRRLIPMEGKENLDSALAQRKGVIAVSAHFGNFALLCAKIAVEGYTFNVIVKEPKDHKIARRLQEYRDILRMKTIPAEPGNRCVRMTLKSLRNNEIVCFIVDEDKRSGGVFVDFFGHPAATATGPAVMSLRTGAPIVPMFIIRQASNENKVIIGPPMKVEKTGDKRMDILSNTAKFTKIIEDYVRRYPSQWSWINSRWKTQPK